MKKRFAIFALVSILLLGACAPALSQQDIQGTVQIMLALTALAEQTQQPAAATQTLAPAPPEAATSEPTLEPATETPPEAVVVFQDIFGGAEAQIRTRIVEPFVLYYRDQPDYPALLTITISIVPDVPGYPYKAEAIFETGITSGFLIGVQDGLVDWWLPECMYSCGFSDSFRAAYPEIVAIMEP